MRWEGAICGSVFCPKSGRFTPFAGVLAFKEAHQSFDMAFKCKRAVG